MLLASWLKLLRTRLWESSCRQRGEGRGARLARAAAVVRRALSYSAWWTRAVPRRRQRSAGRRFLPAEVCEPRVLLSATAVDDTATVIKNTPQAINISANDSASGYLSVTEYFQPSHGDMEIRPNVSTEVWDEWQSWGFDSFDTFGDFYQVWYYEDPSTLTWYAHYTPDSNYTGEDSFLYVISDSQGNLDEAYVEINVVPPSNQTPTVSLTNKVTTLSEGASVATRRKMADIVISDDGQGTNTLGLTGTNASLFEIYDGDLYLKSGVSLSHSSQPTLGVTVTVDDSTVGGTPDGSSGLTVSITQPTNQAPSVSLTNKVTSLSEATSTASRVKMADIVVTDDALGTNTLALTGAQAALFEIYDGDLYLKSGTTLNASSQPQFAVTVTVDDTAVGGTPDSSSGLTVSIQYAPANAINDSVTTEYNQSRHITVLANDQGEGLTITDNTDPQHGTVEIRPDVPQFLWEEWGYWGRYYYDTFAQFYAYWYYGDPSTLVWEAIYTPHTNYSGTDSFTYSIEDLDSNTDSATVTVTVSPPANQTPSVSLTNKVTSLLDTTSTASRIKMADIIVTDDGQGTNTLALTGAQASLFEIHDGDLYLKSGTTLNAATLAQLVVTVTVNDPTVGGNPDGSAGLTVAILPPLDAVNDSATIAHNTSQLINVLGNDIGGDLEITSITQPGHGTVELRPDVDQEIWDEWVSWASTEYETFEDFYSVWYSEPDPQLYYRAYYTPTTGYSGSDSFTYTISNGTTQDTATANITVQAPANLPPSLTLSSIVSNIAENASTTEAIRIANITINDDGLGTNTLSLTGSDAAKFEIVTGSLYLKAGTVLDYETKQSYAVNVIVNDPATGGSPDDSEAVTLSVTNVNDVAPTFTVANARTTPISEEERIAVRTKVADLVVIDDGGEKHWQLTGDDAGLFEVDSTGLYLRAGASFDYDDNPQLNVTVTLDDPLVGSTPDDSEAYTLQVANGNRPPEVAFSNTVTTLLEDADTNSATFLADLDIIDDETSGTLTLNLLGDGGERFQIIDGQLFLKAGVVLDAEANAELRVTVAVDDSALEGEVDATRRFTLAVGNVNDVAPTIEVVSLVTMPLPEDAQLPPDFKFADIRITDDGAGTNVLTLSGDDAALFEIVNFGLYLKEDAELDFESSPVLNVTVNVDDSEFGTGIDDSGTFSAELDDANDAPVVSLENVTPSLPEDTDFTTALAVADVNVEDDATGTAHFVLLGPHHDLFEIIGGELRLKAGTTLDHETSPQLGVTVVAYDNFSVGEDSSVTLTIDITNVNDETPQVILENPRLTPLLETETLTARLKVADVVIHDDGAGTNVLTVEGVDAGLFEVDETGLYVKAGADIDFEFRPYLTVDVVATDSEFPAVEPGRATATFGVGDVNEAPVFTLENTVTTLPESTTVQVPVLVAEVVLSDDSIGYNQLTLSGADAELFTLIGARLYLNAGTVLDHENHPALDVTVQVDDQELGSGIDHTVSLSIAVANVSLSARVDEIRVANTSRGEPVILSVAENDFSEINGTLRIISVSGAAHGSASVIDNSSNFLDDQISYTPDAGFVGAEILTYIVEDANGNQATATVTLNVIRAHDANRAPLAPEIGLHAAPGESVEFSILTSIHDPEGDELSLIAIAQPQHGTLTSTLDVNGDTIYTYTPASGFTGTETLSFTVEDEYGASVTSTVVITVVNHQPRAVEDRYQVEAGTTLTAGSTSRLSRTPSVLANDIELDGDSLTAILVSDVSHGTLVLNANGTFTYTPDEEYSGTDSFTYKVNDGLLDSTVQTVEIEVYPEIEGLGTDNGLIPGTLPQPHPVGGETGGGPIIVEGDPPLDPTLPFSPPTSSGEDEITTTVDDTIVEDDGNGGTDSIDRDLSITRDFDADVNPDGSWSYQEICTAFYTLTTTNEDGVITTAIGTYTYIVSASGDEDGSTFTATTTNVYTLSGSYVHEWSQGEMTFTWSQTVDNYHHIENTSQYDTGMSYGLKQTRNSTTLTNNGIGAYAYDIDGGEVTGSISNMSSSVRKNEFTTHYSASAEDWVMSGSGYSSLINASHFMQNGSGAFSNTSTNSEGDTRSVYGTVNEHGDDNLIESTSANYVLTSGGWLMTTGGGLNTRNGGKSQETVYTGDYTNLIDGGEVEGSFSGNNRDAVDHRTTVVLIGSNGVWTQSGSGTEGGDGDTSFSSSGEGDYILTRVDDELTVQVNGEVKESESSNSSYDSTRNFTLVSGNWALTGGNSTSHRDGNGTNLITEPVDEQANNYTRIQNNDDGVQQGVIYGKAGSLKLSTFDYFSDTAGEVVSGAWVTDGEYSSHQLSLNTSGYAGEGAYSREVALDETATANFTGKLKENSTTFDFHESTSTGILEGDDMVQTGGVGISLGFSSTYFEQNSQDQATPPGGQPPASNDTYNRPLHNNGSVIGTAKEFKSEFSSYDYLAGSLYVNGDWVDQGTRHDHSIDHDSSSYKSNDRVVDITIATVSYDSQEEGGQTFHSESHSTSNLNSQGAWELTSGTGFDSAFGGSSGKLLGTGAFTQPLGEATLTGTIVKDDTNRASSFGHIIVHSVVNHAWVRGLSFRSETDSGGADSELSLTGTAQFEVPIPGSPLAENTATVTQTKTSHSEYSETEFFTLNSAGTWVRTGGFGSSSGNGAESAGIVVENGTYVRDIDHGETEGDLTFSRGGSSNYTFKTDSKVVNGNWVTTGTNDTNSETHENLTMNGEGVIDVPVPVPNGEEGETQLELFDVTDEFESFNTNSLEQHFVMGPAGTWVLSTGTDTQSQRGKDMLHIVQETGFHLEFIGDTLFVGTRKVTAHEGISESKFEFVKKYKNGQWVADAERAHDSYTTYVGSTTELDLIASDAVTVEGIHFAGTAFLKIKSTDAKTTRFPKTYQAATGTWINTGGADETKIISSLHREAGFNADNVTYVKPSQVDLGYITGKASLHSKFTEDTTFIEVNRTTEPNFGHTGHATSSLVYDSTFQYDSGENGGVLARLFYVNPHTGQLAFMFGTTSENGTVTEHMKLDMSYELDYEALVWNGRIDLQENHSKADRHWEMSGRGEYSHVQPQYVVGAGMQVGGSPGAWGEVPEDEEAQYALEYTDYGYPYSLDYQLGTTTRSRDFTGSHTDSRVRDWGHDYSSSYKLEADESSGELFPVRTSEGSSYLKGFVEARVSHTHNTIEDWLVPEGTPYGYYGEVSSSAHANRTETWGNGWRREFDISGDYVLAHNSQTGISTWVRTGLHEVINGTADGTADLHFDFNSHVREEGGSTQDWMGYYDYQSTRDFDFVEGFQSTFHLDRTTTLQPNGTNLVTGTRTWGLDASVQHDRAFTLDTTDASYWYDGNSEYLDSNVRDFDYDITAHDHRVVDNTWSRNLQTNVDTGSNIHTGDGSLDWSLVYTNTWGAEGDQDSDTGTQGDSTSYNTLPTWDYQLRYMPPVFGYNPEDMQTLPDSTPLPQAGWIVDIQEPEDVPWEASEFVGGAVDHLGEQDSVFWAGYEGFEHGLTVTGPKAIVNTFYRKGAQALFMGDPGDYWEVDPETDLGYDAATWAAGASFEALSMIPGAALKCGTLASRAVNFIDDAGALVGAGQAIGDMAEHGVTSQNSGSVAMNLGSMLLGRLFRNCFPAGTLVSTEEGRRPIEEIEAGQRVWSFHHGKSEWVLRPVLETYQFVNDQFAQITLAHQPQGASPRSLSRESVFAHHGDTEARSDEQGSSPWNSSATGLLEAEKITSTAGHPFWVLRGENLDERPRGEHISAAEEELLELRSQIPGRWVDAGDLREGDVLLLDNGQERRIERVTLFEETQPTYNFAVDDLHNYAVGNCGVLVHNTCQPRNAKGQFTSGAGGHSASAASGQVQHANYRNALRQQGYGVEVVIKGAGRADAVDFVNKIVRELKPNSAKAVQRGMRQLNRYKEGLARMTKSRPQDWTMILDTYTP